MGRFSFLLVTFCCQVNICLCLMKVAVDSLEPHYWKMVVTWEKTTSFTVSPPFLLASHKQHLQLRKNFLSSKTNSSFTSKLAGQTQFNHNDRLVPRAPMVGWLQLLLWFVASRDSVRRGAKFLLPFFFVSNIGVFQCGWVWVANGVLNSSWWNYSTIFLEQFSPKGTFKESFPIWTLVASFCPMGMFKEP